MPLHVLYFYPTFSLRFYLPSLPGHERQESGGDRRPGHRQPHQLRRPARRQKRASKPFHVAIATLAKYNQAHEHVY